jgi:hypothetical protein
VFRLLRADRDVAAGVYPMKNFRSPTEGLPAGMTREQFETTYTDYPFNPIGQGKTRVSQYADSDGFVKVAEAPTGFMVIKRHVFLAMMKQYPELNYVPDGPPNNPQAPLHWRFFDCMVDPTPEATCPRTSRSAAAGATWAARSGSTSTAFGDGSTPALKARNLPRPCRLRTRLNRGPGVVVQQASWVDSRAPRPPVPQHASAPANEIVQGFFFSAVARCCRLVARRRILAQRRARRAGVVRDLQHGARHARQPRRRG